LNNHFNITKSKKIRNVPLNKSAFDILQKRKKKMQIGKVFTYKGNEMNKDFISKKFKKLVLKA